MAPTDLQGPDKITFDPSLVEAARYWARHYNGAAADDSVRLMSSQLQNRMRSMPLIGSKKFPKRISPDKAPSLYDVKGQEAAKGQQPQGRSLGFICHDRGPKPVFAPRPGMEAEAQRLAPQLAQEGIEIGQPLTKKEADEQDAQQHPEQRGGLIDPTTEPPINTRQAEECARSFVRQAIAEIRSHRLSQMYDWSHRNFSS